MLNLQIFLLFIKKKVDVGLKLVHDIYFLFEILIYEEQKKLIVLGRADLTWLVLATRMLVRTKTIIYKF